MNYNIVTPLKDEGNYIRDTIESITGQTHLPNKWIIIDDYSSDNSISIGKAYLSRGWDTMDNYAAQTFGWETKNIKYTILYTLLVLSIVFSFQTVRTSIETRIQIQFYNYGEFNILPFSLEN